MIISCLPIATDTHPDAILNMALGQLEDVIVVGKDKAGDLWVSGSMADISYLHWLLSRAIAKCIDEPPFQLE